jgi:Domain of unknown function (DUF4123)
MQEIRSLFVSPQSLRLYALVDAAQNEHLVDIVAKDDNPNACLFNYALDLPVAQHTPRLVEIHRPDESLLLRWIEQHARSLPVATLLASELTLQALTEHFQAQMDVTLEDLDSMFLAFWDPAILASLLGNPSDDTLHVPGPIFTTHQRTNFLNPIQYWWYWNRDGLMHELVNRQGLYLNDRHGPIPLPKVTFEQHQIDLLVEASVPDHLLHHIRQNQPSLLMSLPSEQHYAFVRQQLERARDHGLEGTGDLVNYVCVALSYGSEFDTLASVVDLLAQVKTKALRFDDAMQLFSEVELEANKKQPELLA